jgi:hypothetical protein
MTTSFFNEVIERAPGSWTKQLCICRELHKRRMRTKSSLPQPGSQALRGQYHGPQRFSVWRCAQLECVVPGGHWPLRSRGLASGKPALAKPFTASLAGWGSQLREFSDATLSSKRRACL